MSLSKAEKDRRKLLLKEQARNERVAAEAAMPLLLNDLKALFDYLDTALAAGCDHSCALTQQFLAARNIEAEPVLLWLQQYGGYCDCEILANVEDYWS